MHNKNGEWKTSQSEFKGYVRASLESIHNEISEIKGIVKTQNTLCSTTTIAIRQEIAQLKIKDKEHDERLSKALKQTKKDSSTLGAISGAVTSGAIKIVEIVLDLL